MTVFLITGVTGNLGAAALHSLRERVPAADLRVLVRTASDASRFTERGLLARIADYADQSSLDAAFADIDRLIFVSSPTLDPVVRAAQHTAVVTSAVAAGVQHIVYTSGMGARHDPGHSAAEDALAESGVHHAILRNALYTDAFAARAIAETDAGEVITSASDGQSLATASIADLGAAAAIASVSTPAKRLWELRGPAWNFDRLALALSAALERSVRHVEVTDQETGAFAVLFPLVRRGVFASETPDLAELLGRAPATIADVVEQMRPQR